MWLMLPEGGTVLSCLTEIHTQVNLIEVTCGHSMCKPLQLCALMLRGSKQFLVNVWKHFLNLQ